MKIKLANVIITRGAYFTGLVLFFLFISETSLGAGGEFTCHFFFRSEHIVDSVPFKNKYLRLRQIEAIDSLFLKYTKNIDQTLDDLSYLREEKHPLSYKLEIKDGSEGENNHGIFVVKSTKNHERVLKISLTWEGMEIDESIREHTGVKENLVIQKFLGDAGVSPRVHHLLFEAPNYRQNEILLEEFIDEANMHVDTKIPDFHHLSRRVGIIMEYYPGAINHHKSNLVRERLEGWDAETFKSALRKMKQSEFILNKYKISSDGDLQFFITKSGRLMLGDLDSYRFRRPWEPMEDFSYFYKQLIRAWLETQHIKIDDSKWEDFFGISFKPELVWELGD